MSLLIDGYNLLFAAGMMPRDAGPATLHRARLALLNYLLEHLTADDIRQTVVVFDAKDAPRGLPDEIDHRGLRVRFARDHDEADDLIEQLIRHESVPRQLCVITSDLRLRTAAQRRRSRSIKSEDWLDQIERQRSPANDADVPPTPTAQRREASRMSADELRGWLETFGLEAGEAETEAEDAETAGDVAPATSDDDLNRATPSRRRPTSSQPGANAQDASCEQESQEVDGWGPFPAGYGEDLLEGTDESY